MSDVPSFARALPLTEAERLMSLPLNDFGIQTKSSFETTSAIFFSIIARIPSSA